MACSHVWIDPKDAPIARASYAPVVGPLRRQMKVGTVYHCQNCGEQLMWPEGEHDDEFWRQRTDLAARLTQAAWHALEMNRRTVPLPIWLVELTEIAQEAAAALAPNSEEK